MQTLWTQFAIDLLTPVLLALVSLAAAYAAGWIRQSVTHVQTKDALLRVTAVTETAVAEVFQTMVDGLRSRAADGELTAADAKLARDEALAKARGYLGPKGVDAVRKALGSDEQALDRWLLALIEAEVRRQKGDILRSGLIEAAEKVGQ